MESSSERQRMVNPRKAYPVDPGLIPVFDRTGRSNVGHARLRLDAGAHGLTESPRVASRPAGRQNTAAQPTDDSAPGAALSSERGFQQDDKGG